MAKQKGVCALKPKQLKAIELYLADNRSWTDVAEKVGVTRHVLYQWRTRNKAFVNELNRQHSIHVREIASRCAANFAFVDSVFRQIAADESNSSRDRLEAANSLQNGQLKRYELLLGIAMREQYGDRLSDVEEKVYGHAVSTAAPVNIPDMPIEELAMTQEAIDAADGEVEDE